MGITFVARPFPLPSHSFNTTAKMVKDNPKTQPKKTTPAPKKSRSAISDVVAREYTIHLKKRAPRAIKEIRKFATMAMGTKDVRLDPQLNKKVWESGIKGDSQIRDYGYGNQGRPSRPTIEQEGLGIRNQGRFANSRLWLWEPRTSVSTHN